MMYIPAIPPPISPPILTPPPHTNAHKQHTLGSLGAEEYQPRLVLLTVHNTTCQQTRCSWELGECVETIPHEVVLSNSLCVEHGDVFGENEAQLCVGGVIITGGCGGGGGGGWLLRVVGCCGWMLVA